MKEQTRVEFVEQLMKNFEPPFCSEGLVRVKRRDEIYKEPALSIQIHNRDVTLTEEGVVGAGTLLMGSSEPEKPRSQYLTSSFGMQTARSMRSAIKYLRPLYFDDIEMKRFLTLMLRLVDTMDPVGT